MNISHKKMKDYKINIIDNMDKWEGISNRWNDLLTQSSANTIFLTWEWLFSWAETYIREDRQLFIITVFDDEELVGIAPWYVDGAPSSLFRLRKIEFLGSPEAGSDYLDVIIKKGREKKVTQRIYDFLFAEGARLWDCFFLRDIPAGSLFLLHFFEKIKEAGKYAEIHPGSFCPVAALPASNEDFLSGLSSHHRLQLRRHRKILEKEGNATHHSFAGPESEISLDTFLSFHRDKKGSRDERFYSLLKTFVSRCKGKDWVQIDILSAGEKPVAGFFHFRYGNILHQYIMVTDRTFNPKVSIGNILIGFCIEESISRGFSAYDFLKGAEEFKFSWTGGGRSSLTLFFPQRKILPLIFTVKNFIKAAAKIALR
jgi:CelD/BcsL family acetyltransferase involved in cellulose biosynthesis